LRGLHHVVWGQVPEQIVTPASILGLLVIVMATGVEVRAVTLMTVHVTATAIAYVVGLILLRSRMPSEAIDTVRRYEDRRWLSGVVPFMLLGGFQQLSSDIGVVLVGQLGDASAAGMFRIAVRGAELVAFG